MGADVVPLLPATIAALPAYVRGRYPEAPVLGRCQAGGVSWIRGRELADTVRELGAGLVALGLRPGDRVAIASESRPEWVLADFAILGAGAVSAAVYPTLAPDQVAYILRDCGATIAVVSSAAQLDKVLSVAGQAPGLTTIVVMDPPEVMPSHERVSVLSLAEVAARGRESVGGAGFEAQTASVSPDDLATLIYTSGTTGEPKGVMLTHANLIANLQDICMVLRVDHTDRAVSFLPLSHSFERMVAWVFLANGLAMAFAESNETIGRDLLRVQPTVMTAVPRVFEKLQARILERGSALTGPRGALFRWAMGVARARGQYLSEGRPLPTGLRIRTALAEPLVFRKVREGLGGRFRFLVSGSAALNTDVARFFFGVGLTIIEGYGLTETAPVLTVTPLHAIRLGAVGVALPRVELKIAGDGEILAKGPNIMRGYYNRPADTADVLRDGWFHTGDIGALDADGYLRITDRKKELLVTTGGKKIAPQPIEAMLKASPVVSEAVLLGEGRHFPAALLVPNLAALAARLQEPVPDTEDAVRAWLARPQVQETYAGIVEQVNAGLAQFERIKQFRLLPREFTLDSGELTPTFKVKRRVIDTMYAAEIASIYGD